jgi:8-oxo-dGTP pyrophosphatase MutT (NUDIX family)
VRYCEPVTPIPAATVILVRARSAGGGVETLLLRRHKKSGFMSDAFVFPGGKLDLDDAGPDVAAIRESFEEAGVLLATPELSPERRADWRARLNARTATFGELVAAESLTPSRDRLRAWARWVTPSVEPKRFDTRFFLAILPPGQVTSFDDKETTEEAWLTPAEALERHAAGTIKLPPPQVRTLHEMAPHAHTLDALLAEADRRAPHIAPIMPRFTEIAGGMGLLLPWDPDYETRGQGEGTPWPAANPLGAGPSRFVLQGMSWRLEYAPGREPTR